MSVMSVLARSKTDRFRTPVPQPRDWLVTEIPVQEFGSHRAALKVGSWMGWFDMAVWLKTPAGAMQPLQLELVYRDSSGEKRVRVDHCPSGGHKTVLLNAALPLSVSGQVEWAAFVVRKLAPEVKVTLDEWHFIPQERRPG